MTLNIFLSVLTGIATLVLFTVGYAHKLPIMGLSRHKNRYHYFYAGAAFAFVVFAYIFLGEEGGMSIHNDIFKRVDISTPLVCYIGSLVSAMQAIAGFASQLKKKPKARPRSEFEFPAE